MFFRKGVGDGRAVVSFMDVYRRQDVGSQVLETDIIN